MRRTKASSRRLRRPLISVTIRNLLRLVRVQNPRRRRRSRDPMKLTTGILAITITMTAGAISGQAFAQNPDAIDNARSVAKSLQQKQANDSNAALDAAGVPAAPATAKPAPGAPAPTVKQIGRAHV